MIYVLTVRLFAFNAESAPIGLFTSLSEAKKIARTLASVISPNGQFIHENDDPDSLNIFFQHPDVAYDDHAFIAVHPINLDAGFPTEVVKDFNRILRYLEKK